MRDQLAWVAFLHAALFIAASGYAAFLDQEHIYRRYSPDYVWLTVVGGDILIWPFVAALCLIGIAPEWIPLYYITLHIAAGLPIIRWQFKRKARRRAELEAIDQAIKERV
jgi:hypothetical protein